MANLDLPDNILLSLSHVLQQLQQSLPALKQETDFSAIAFKWQDRQLIAIQQPRKIGWCIKKYAKKKQVEF